MHTLLGCIPNLRLEIPNVWRVVMLVAVSGCCAWGSAPPEPEFSSQPHPFPGFRSGSLAWADFDNDGDLDLFVCGSSFTGQWGIDFSHVYRNDSGTFVNTGMVLPGYSSGSADWADFDNDGFVDLVVTGLSEEPGTRVYRNIGGSNLVQFALLPDVFNGRAAWGDFNQDGFPDLAMTGGTTTGSGLLTRVFANNGGSNFSQFVILPPETYHGTMDWADYDHDGWLDLLSIGEVAGLAQIYRNEGDEFVPLEFPIMEVASGMTGQWMDANTDGWPDLLILSHSVEHSFVLINNGAGSFLTASSLDMPMLGAQAVGDCNNDGFNDVLIAGYRYSKPIDYFIWDQTGLFINSGTGEWLERTNLIANLGAAAAAWGDYDRDGRLDLIVHGQSETNRQVKYSTYLYRNVTARSNEVPQSPTGLNAVIQGDRVLLSWNAAVDANQSGGLTYNVRVGSAPGLGDIVSPMSAPDGWRRVVKGGNADGRTFYALRGLQSRHTYYWSVQAVDNSFSGSAFAAEAAFAVTRPPSASNQVVVANEDASRTMILTGSDPDGDALSFLVLSVPTNGTLAGTAPNLIYTPKTNFHGQDAFRFQVSDGLAASPPATINITVLPVNDSPVADASATRTLWISRNGTNAPVTLNGSRSFDIDGDSLAYLWRVVGRTNVLGTGEVAVARLPVGTHFIELVLSDGSASDTHGIAVKVFTTGQALRQLVSRVRAQVARPRPLINILSAAIASLDRGSKISAVIQLKAFQNRVRVQVTRFGLDPALANELIQEAQAVIDAIIGIPSATARPPYPGSAFLLEWPCQKERAG
jgi:hypothetical protein